MQTLLDGLCARSGVAVRVEADPALYRPNDTPLLLGSNARLRADTDWTPLVSFDRMLDDLMAFWRETVRSSEPEA